jgi:DNA primase
MERYPDGIDRPGFFQKNAGRGLPGWVKTVTVTKVGGTVPLFGGVHEKWLQPRYHRRTNPEEP